MKELKGLFKNYKTSIPALLGVVLIGLYVWGKIDSEQLTIGIGALGSLGLLAAKDHTTPSK